MAEERVKRMGKRKKKRRWIKWAVLAVVFLLIAALAGYIISIFKDYDYHPLDTSDLGISQDENLGVGRRFIRHCQYCAVWRRSAQQSGTGAFRLGHDSLGGQKTQ